MRRPWCPSVALCSHADTNLTRMQSPGPTTSAMHGTCQCTAPSLPSSTLSSTQGMVCTWSRTHLVDMWGGCPSSRRSLAQTGQAHCRLHSWRLAHALAVLDTFPLGAVWSPAERFGPRTPSGAPPTVGTDPPSSRSCHTYGYPAPLPGILASGPGRGGGVVWCSRYEGRCPKPL